MYIFYMFRLFMLSIQYIGTVSIYFILNLLAYYISSQFLSSKDTPICNIGLPKLLTGKGSTCQCRRHRSNPWVRKILWRRKWQTTPIFFPGKSRGQRILVGYSPWGHKRVQHDWVTKQQYVTYMETESGKWKSLSRVWLFASLWTIQSMEFSRPEYWSG